jgi:hypothetical protein
MSTAATAGMLYRECIRASAAPSGSALSCAIANIMRIAAVFTAGAYTMIAMTMQMKKTVPTGRMMDIAYAKASEATRNAPR